LNLVVLEWVKADDGSALKFLACKRGMELSTVTLIGSKMNALISGSRSDSRGG